jgi:hypothetical protein
VRRVALTALLGLLAVLAGAAAGGSANAAAGQLTDGVWWMAQVTGGTLPPPPQVPAHGLWVSSAASGPTAISALHADLDSDQVASTLTLHVANLYAAPATPVAPLQVPVLACPTTAAWKPVDAATPGAWDSRPAYDCGKGQVQGSLSADGTKMAFDLTSLAVPGKALDIVLVPGQAPSPVPQAPVPVPVPLPDTPASGNTQPTFDITFVAPTPADVVIGTVGDTGQSDVADALGGTVSDSTATGSTSTPVLNLPTTLGAPLGTTAGVTRPLGPPVVNVPVATARALAPISSTSPRKRLLFGLVFVDLMVWAWRVLSVDSGGRAAAAMATVRRPSLTLYDVPAAPATRVTGHHFAKSTREGRPPPLR